jgi:hypothetical protein
VLRLVPHDIDWVKDRVRWYWEHKLVKPRKPSDPTTTTEPEKKNDSSCSALAAATTSPVVVAPTAKEVSIAA